MQSVVKSLISAGADINPTGDSVLVRTLEFGSSNSEVIQILHRVGAFLNGTDHKGRTPLMLAVIMNDYKIVDELIKAGANVNMTDNAGHTALHFISWFDSLPSRSTRLYLDDPLDMQRLHDILRSL